MSEGAYGRIGRITISDESTIYTSGGNYQHIAAPEEITYTHEREALADNRQLLISKGQYAAHLGRKSGEVSFTAPLHAATYSELQYALKSAFGQKSTRQAVFSAANTTTLTIDAGANFDPLMQVTIGGVEIIVPIKSISGAVGTYAILPGGSASACATALDTTGACYIQDYTAAVTTLNIQCDKHGESDYVPYTFTGAVPTKCELNLDLSQRLSLNWSFMVGDWTANTAANVASPSAMSGQFLGYAAQCYLQDIGTPAAGTQIDLHSLQANLCWEFIPREATRANTSNLVPGSPISGYKAGVWCPEGVTMTLTKNANAYVTARTNKTPFGFLMVWSTGGPGDTATTNGKIGLWFPRLVLDRDPKEVDIDGLMGVELHFAVELESALTGSAITQGCLMFTS